MPWEQGFWGKFLDPNISAVDMLSSGLKRPFPFHVVDENSDGKRPEVEIRVMASSSRVVRSFLQHIRDVPVKTWREEREATWETAIRRWVVLLDQWNAQGTPLLESLQSKQTFLEKAQIMVDVFYKKAPQTLLKRVDSLSKMCGAMTGQEIVFSMFRGTVLHLFEERVTVEGPGIQIEVVL